MCKVVEIEGTAVPYWKHFTQDPGEILSRILRFEHFLSRSLKSCVLLESMVLEGGHGTALFSVRPRPLFNIILLLFTRK